jgi:uncharacterized protein YgbK (DUF1537 family)
MSELLLAYYGDDFTGSTDTLEALSINGVPTVLFLDAPHVARLDRFAGVRAVGVAGVSRSRSPAWMSAHLPGVFRILKDLSAPICQYKVCSTFDSSPQTGSIGRAIEIGQDIFGNPCVPVVVGVPALGRYVLFGHLFARAGGEVYRIDRHPTMKSHPVTPMTESDLRVHLARQTQRKIGLVDILAIRSGVAESRWRALSREGCQVAIFDGLDEESLLEIGRILWTRRLATQTFAVGSSGLDYALAAYWRAAGIVRPVASFPDVRPAERIVVVSGSCSPVTEKQLRWAMAKGFAGMKVAPDGASFDEVRQRALEELARGRSVAIHTALGPADQRPGIVGEDWAQRLGTLLRELLEVSGVRRAVLAGGDTAGHAGRQLGLYALTFVRPLDPGAPLCRAWSDNPQLDGLELVFKGGQIGGDDFFGAVLHGRR